MARSCFRCQLDMRHDFARAVNPFIAICARTKKEKILTGACLFCESVQLRYVKRTLLYILTLVVTPPPFSVTPNHMALAALTDALYTRVVLIFPMIIYTDSAQSPLLLVEADSP